MGKKELETKLEQVQIKRNAIFADIESLRSNEQEADKEIAGIKAEIEAVDKPELRHGDVYPAYGPGGEPRIVIGFGENAKVYSPSGREGTIWAHGRYENSKPTFNAFAVFTDLATIGEPLEEFETGNGMKVKFDSGGWLHFSCTRVSSENVHDFILNLRRMEATQKAGSGEQSS